MYTLIIVVFVAGYVGIALEHSIKVNKTAIAIVTGIICWTLFMFSTPGESLLQSNDYQKFLSITKLEQGSSTEPHQLPAELHREFVTFSLSEHLGDIFIDMSSPSARWTNSRTVCHPSS